MLAYWKGVRPLQRVDARRAVTLGVAEPAWQAPAIQANLGTDDLLLDGHGVLQSRCGTRTPIFRLSFS
jgi:hypothetical protein